MIKDIIVNLAIDNKGDRARDYAISLADKLDAHLTGIAFSYEPVLPMMGGGMEAIPAEYIDELRAENEKAARLAKANFQKSVGEAGLRSDCYSPNASAAGAAALFARIGRHFDLAVVQQAEATTPEYDYLIESTLFEGGRPVIVVPYIHKAAPSFKRALVCWDGSKPAARAIADAIPLLRRADKIEVITIAEAGKVTEEFPGAEIGQHLTRHGLKIEIKRIDVAKIDVGNTILSYAADVGADFVVMGAYGHTRIREFVLGGVTNTILSSMTVPVLMSH
jgi:nucleotide-binding universal stress UspA family protein